LDGRGLLLNYSGLWDPGRGGIWKFFSRSFSASETGGRGALFKNWSAFFCGFLGPFFSAAEKPEKSKILGRQRGVTTGK
jgi:hypothetical protein